MKCTVDRNQFKTETGRKLFDLLKQIWDDYDFVIGTLAEVKGDKNRQKMIDLIEKDGITDDETLILAAGAIVDGVI